MSDPTPHDADHPHRNNQGTPWLEWAASGTGLILTLLTLGFIGWQAVQAGSMPPAIAVAVRHIAPTAAGYTVEIRAENRSGRTAAKVEVVGEVKRGAEVVETSRTVFDFVPGNSHSDGGLFFRQDPRTLTLDVRPLGYVEP